MADLTSSYQQKFQQQQTNDAATELDAVFPSMADEIVTGPEVAMNLLEGPPRRVSSDALGRVKPTEEQQSTAGKVLHNIGEMAPSALKGVNEAVMNATMWLNPLSEWLDQNVADLSFEYDQPETTTGQVTKDIVQFLTGFVPAVKGLKAMGMTNKVATPMVAGAVADFATRGGHEAKLSDVWKQAGLPENMLTDFLASDPNDTEMLGRAKAAIEGLALGPVVEAGMITSMMAIRGVKNAIGKTATKTEEQILKDKYGELTDEEMASVVGDPSKPMIETKIVQPPAISKKIPKAEGELPNLDPRALIRTTKKTKIEEPLAGHKTTELGDVVVTESAKQPGKFQVTFWDGKAGKGKPTQDMVFDSREEAIAAFDGAGDGKILKQSWGAPLYHYGADVPTEKLAPGTWVTADKDGAMSYSEKIGGGGKLHEMNIDVGNIASEKDVRSVLKEIGHPLADIKVTKLWDLMHDEMPEELMPKFIDALRGRGFGAVKVKDTYFGDERQMDSLFLVDSPKPPSAQIKSEDFETYINFARIDEPEQVKFTIGKMAEAMKGQVDEARRGVITQRETQRMADDLGMTVAELLERRKGQPLNAEEALAARQLWAASGEKLLEAAKKAAGPNAGALDQFAFRRAMAVHSAIQNEVIGARTETARALASWKIPAGGSVEKARAIEQVMGAMGGPEASKEMAKRLAIMAETGASPSAIAKFARQGAVANTVDAIKQIWVNGLLTSPKTHIVNSMSNSLVIAQQIYERAAAAQIGKLSGGGGVEPGEASVMLFGIMQSYRDAFRMAARALKTGETGYAFNKVDVSHPNAVSSEAFNLARNSTTGKFVDFLGHAVDMPGRLLGAEDEFFKTIGYRMEINAQALRTARQEGLTGQALKERMAELIENPPEHIRINAADAAMYNTFTNEMGSIGKAMMNMRDNTGTIPGAVFTFVLPFIRTPTNIARYSFERTPFAPLVGQWRADIAAGGARADLALARMATGTAIMATAMDMALNGDISGAGPSGAGPDKDVRESLMRSGWQPYSIKVGDRWYSYSRTDPFGMTVGFAASIAEAVQNGEIDAEDVDEWQEVTGMAIMAVSQNVVNKTYMEGVSSIIEAISDPTRYNEKYINDALASFVPMTALSGTVKGVVDPIQREVNSPADAVYARIAMLSEKLPPRRDLWGRPVKIESGLGKVYDALSPVASRQEDVQPIDKEITRLGQGPQRIAKRGGFFGAHVNFKKWPEVYDEYTRLAGNDLKHPAWGMGAMEYLNAVVSGKHPASPAYNKMSDEARQNFISNEITEYRKLAQYQIMNDPKFADFAAEVNQLKELQMRSRMPVFDENQ